MTKIDQEREERNKGTPGDRPGETRRGRRYKKREQDRGTTIKTRRPGQIRINKEEENSREQEIYQEGPVDRD